MPPTKQYIFNHIYNPRIQILIDAHSFIEAMEKLTEATKHPTDFKCINP